MSGKCQKNKKQFIFVLSLHLNGKFKVNKVNSFISLSLN
ncbi:hypothetical protein VC87395_001887 [Vibrio paracholerae 87395]|nr:hypothetical protein VC87395_001887 [Vibrio paracholerae 87395]